MSKNMKSKVLCIPAPEDGSIADGKREYRVVYSIDVRASSPRLACMEAIKVLSDQLNGLHNPGTFPPVFQVISS
jgi:hypothetical protein